MPLQGRVRPRRVHRLVPIVLPVLAGCAAFGQRPEVRIAQVTIVSVGLTGATAGVGLEVVNPNRFDLRAREVRYALDFHGGVDQDWHTVATGASADELRVGARDTLRVELSVTFRYEDVGAALARLLEQGRLEYRVYGDVRFAAPVGSWRVSFDRRGTVEP